MLNYILALVILTVVLIGNALGSEKTGVSMNYFDSILHLLAGIGLGFFLCALTASVGPYRWHKLWVVVLVVFIGGLAWEVFEGYFGITGYGLWTDMYYLDTIKDLILDIVGAALVAHIVIKR